MKAARPVREEAARKRTPLRGAPHRAAYFTPNLHNRLKALPGQQVPTGHTSHDRSHGRRETRTLNTVAAGLGFPHAAQAIRIHRWRTPLNHGGKHTGETTYAITTLPAEHAQPAQLAGWTRHHWHIENKLHHVRDVTFGENAHQARTGNGPAVMATLRNTALTLIRATGHTNIARATRYYTHRPHAAVTLATSENTTTQ